MLSRVLTPRLTMTKQLSTDTSTNRHLNIRGRKGLAAAKKKDREDHTDHIYRMRKEQGRLSAEVNAPVVQPVDDEATSEVEDEAPRRKPKLDQAEILKSLKESSLQEANILAGALRDASILLSSAYERSSSTNVPNTGTAPRPDS